MRLGVYEGGICENTQMAKTIQFLKNRKVRVAAAEWASSRAERQSGAKL